MQIIVSAPGKIHLLGEHAVVYDHPALIAAIDKRLYINIKYQKLNIKNKKDVVIKTTVDPTLVYKAISVFKNAFSIKALPPIEINITSQIPIGSGLGSSASLSAATIGALMKYVKNLWNPNRINELTFEVEKLAHGNPSGADNTTVVFGGLVWYRREFDFLKSIWSLPISSYKIPKFVLINSGRPKETTKEMIDVVTSLYKRNKKKLEDIFINQEKLTKRLLLSLRSGDDRELIKSIMLGERNLERIEVVGNFARKVIRVIEKIGGAAKVCGAGGKKEGSGVLLCYHRDSEKIEMVAKKYNLPSSKVVLGGEGIRLEVT